MLVEKKDLDALKREEIQRDVAMMWTARNAYSRQANFVIAFLAQRGFTFFAPPKKVTKKGGPLPMAPPAKG